MELLNIISSIYIYINIYIYICRYTKDNALLEEIKEAARKANALEFIEKNDFETLPGDEN